MYKSDTETRNLKCELTRDEFDERAHALATIAGDIGALESEKKRQADHFKGKIDGLETKRVELSMVVKNRAEYRDIECRWHEDLDGKQMILVRTDTGAVIEQRPMTREELQQKLKLPTGRKRGDTEASTDQTDD